MASLATIESISEQYLKMMIPISQFQDSGLAENPPSRLLDLSDEELLAVLQVHVPVTSERNIWAFWDKGFNAMPPWCQRNVFNWIRRQGKFWTVRVLDTVPGSQNNIWRYVSPLDFPEAARESRMNGEDAGQHTGDLVRLAALYEYGGVYMDVSIMMIRDLDDICWSALEDPTMPYEVAGMAQQMGDHFGVMLNSMIASRKRSPFIHRWLQVCAEIWADRKDSTGLHDHPLIRHLGLLRIKSPSISPEADWVGFTDYLWPFQAYERVRLNREPGPEGFDGPAYFRKHFFLLDAGSEMFRGQDFDGGEDVARMLALPYKPVDIEDDRDQASAHQFVCDLLARSSVCKFSSGTARLGLPFLVAKHWSKQEHANDDCLPGTWGEILRYGSVHLQQLRDQRGCLKPIMIPEEKANITKVGMLEPVLA